MIHFFFWKSSWSVFAFVASPLLVFIFFLCLLIVSYHFFQCFAFLTFESVEVLFFTFATSRPTSLLIFNFLYSFCHLIFVFPLVVWRFLPVSSYIQLICCYMFHFCCLLSRTDQWTVKNLVEILVFYFFYDKNGREAENVEKPSQCMSILQPKFRHQLLRFQSRFDNC